MTVAETYLPAGARRGSAIVFYPATQTFKTTKLKTLDDDQVTSRQSAPKWNSHVPIYVEHDDTKRLAATLDLGKLGWANNVMRLCGKYSEILVVDSDCHPSSGLVEAS
jgi:hypothetical protein